jgi:hypothetical protein
MMERTVNFKTTMLLPLALSVAFTTAAEANYFYNPRANISYSVGSAPSPRPVDIRVNRQPQVSEMSFPTAPIKVTAEEVMYFQIVVDASGPRIVASNTPFD